MTAEVVIAGAGLAAALAALRLSAVPDPPRVLLLDERPQPFAGHTWSFHADDLAPGAEDWLGPAVAARWPGQEVRFPAFTRRLSTGYASVTPEALAAALAAHPGVTLRRGARVEEMRADGVRLADGETIPAACVIDARGFLPHPALRAGVQKFLGQEVRTEAPHGLSLPVIMDARVAQSEGYRFVYLLPFGPDRLLIEDTRYTESGRLDRDALRAAIRAYAAAQGWRIREVLREEEGALPIALGFDARAFWADQPPDIPRIGMRALRFHPVTGYSLPEAARAAETVARHWRHGSPALARVLRREATERARAQGFYRLLSRMLFDAARPQDRWRVLERFYRLPEPLIARFYAGTTTSRDKARILIGRPPVPVSRALLCLAGPIKEAPRDPA